MKLHRTFSSEAECTEREDLEELSNDCAFDLPTFLLKPKREDGSLLISVEGSLTPFWSASGILGRSHESISCEISHLFVNVILSRTSGLSLNSTALRYVDRLELYLSFLMTKGIPDRTQSNNDRSLDQSNRDNSTWTWYSQSTVRQFPLLIVAFVDMLYVWETPGIWPNHSFEALILTSTVFFT